jgi:Ca2+-binding EF-hand superfamily protein
MLKAVYSVQVIADNMTPEEIRGLELLFESMDTDHSGTITVDELQDALRQQGSLLVESEVQALLEAVRSTVLVISSFQVFVLLTDAILFDIFVLCLCPAN